MKITSEQPKIMVVGSSSVDLVLNTENYPMPNETVLASKSESFFGGKGANQAVAASRLGAGVYFVGAVGMDPYGQQILRNLVDEGVNVGFVREREDYATGTAYVTAAQGKNAIVVVPAANFTLRPDDVEVAERFLAQSELVLLQLEIPLETVAYTVDLAKRHGTKVGIYAAPAQRLPEAVLDYASFIVVKSGELNTVFGDKWSREEILRRYENRVFVRDDSNSTTYFNGEEMIYLRNDREDVLNKMGMGDAFTAGFAVAFCHGNTVNDCVKFGNEVSLKVAVNRGSQRGLPYLRDLMGKCSQ
ncbi:ribokinase [Bergeyella sp. RCAD1439]|uniref:ribokinase n=1 Tax=Bergeyella anatis TaxID=3113737 RepID=UPI002E19D3E5|nr:ribokinase [Bergeyella sp. RCAD1439]